MDDNLKPGDLVWVQWSDQEKSECILIYTSRGQRRSDFKLLASNNRVDLVWPSFDPDWDSANDCKKISRQELPLYVWMPFKTARFQREMLKA
jgi:hypothetical protein